MKLIGLCIETTKVEALVAFYEVVFNTKATGADIHYEFPEQQLAIYNPMLGENREVPETKSKGNVLLFYVENVDEEYERLKKENVTLLHEPVDKPWGTRVFSLYDPENNKVNILSHKSEG